MGESSLSKNLQVAVAIDVRVRQLALQGVSGHALADRMIGYMPELQKLWTSATDEELAAYCRDYPGFLRYARVMEEVSERMRADTGIPAGVKQLSPLPDHFKQSLERLFTQGSGLERGLQGLIDESSRNRLNVKTTPLLQQQFRELDAVYCQWGPAILEFLNQLQASGLSSEVQHMVRQSLESMASRIDSLHETAVLC